MGKWSYRLSQQRRHALKRAFQRFGLRLNNQDLLDLAEEIRAGKLERVTRGIKGCVFRKNAWTVDLLIAYDEETQQVCTFLKPEWAEDGFYDD